MILYWFRSSGCDRARPAMRKPLFDIVDRDVAARDTVATSVRVHLRWGSLLRWISRWTWGRSLDFSIAARRGREPQRHEACPRAARSADPGAQKAAIRAAPRQPERAHSFAPFASLRLCGSTCCRWIWGSSLGLRTPAGWSPSGSSRRRREREKDLARIMQNTYV
jgi:hypothetical protein